MLLLGFLATAGLLTIGFVFMLKRSPRAIPEMLALNKTVSAMDQPTIQPAQKVPAVPQRPIRFPRPKSRKCLRRAWRKFCRQRVAMNRRIRLQRS